MDRVTANGPVLIDGQGSPLAVAQDPDRRLETLMRFLSRYGVLLLADGESFPAEGIRFRILGEPTPFTSRGSHGVHVHLRQEVDGFLVEDAPVAARFQGTELQRVTGRLFDPADSPARGMPLALPNRAAVNARFGLAAAADPTPSINFSERTVVWRLGKRRFDAVSGRELDPTPVITGCP